jgi:heat-inducible transcriptional repressor
MSEGAEALSARQRRILFALCREYIVDGRPVASAALSRATGIEWSSATIRHELVVLEQLGFLHQPHSASGRFPTARGLQAFIDELARTREPRAEHREVLEVGLRDVADSGRAVRAATQVLSQLVGCVAVGFVAAPREGRIASVRLVATAPLRALAIVTLEGGAVSVHPVELEPEDAASLDQIAGRLAELTVGHTLEEARAELAALLVHDEARVDGALAAALEVGLRCYTAAALEPESMQVAGQGRLAREPWSDGDELAALLAVLEDDRRLASVLCQLLPPPPSGELQAPHAPQAPYAPQALVRFDLALRRLSGWSERRVRAESADPAERGREAPTRESPGVGLALVGTRVAMMPQPPRMGVLALIGPPRLDYETAIPLVEYAARAVATRP